MTVPPPAVCRLCSKPIKRDSLAVFENSEWFHVKCRRRGRHRKSSEAVDPAGTVSQRPGGPVDQAMRHESSHPPSIQQASGPAVAVCPLCTSPAIVTDWRPVAPWIVIEGCPCSGFFLWAPLMEHMPTVPLRDRHVLMGGIQRYRRLGYQAWCATADGKVTGSVVIHAVRPDRGHP
jgi:hypothetical protein